MARLMEVDHSCVLRIAERLVARRETVAVSESSAGGLISAALLAAPGASRYYLGGGVIYTRKAMGALLELGPDKLEGIRSATEPMARLLAETVPSRLGADWDAPKPAGHRPDRQPLWRRRRARLPRGLGTARGEPGAGDRIERPDGQHGRVRERGAGAAGGMRLPSLRSVNRRRTLRPDPCARRGSAACGGSRYCLAWRWGRLAATAMPLPNRNRGPHR